VGRRILAVNAESAYLFRHALLRDAAYQLQLPSDRAKLHALAFETIEAIHGGRAPDPPPLDGAIDAPFKPHPIDECAEELADHIQLAPRNARQAALCRLYLRRAAETAERNYRNHAARRLFEVLAERLEGAARGEALRRAADMALFCGNPKEAIPLLEQAIHCQRVAGRRELEARAVGCLAGLYKDMGSVAPAESNYRTALALARAVGDRKTEGVTLANLANLCWEDARLEEAENFHKAAEAIHREVRNVQSLGIVKANLAGIYHVTGRLELAVAAYQEALALLDRNTARLQRGVILQNYALLQKSMGHMSHAERDLKAAIVIHRECGNLRSEGNSLGNLAAIYRETARPAAAEAAYVRALEILRDCGRPRFESNHLCDYALLLLETDRPQAARSAWQRAQTLLRSLAGEAELVSRRAQMLAACEKAGVTPLDEAVPTQPS
jgi:tetratricopeptide (TPR) repeat protein